MGRLTEAHNDIMRHALGLDRSTEAYRNYFCADPHHSDMPMILDMCAHDCMRPSHTINDGKDTIYVVTPAGRAALAQVNGASRKGEG